MSPLSQFSLMHFSFDFYGVSCTTSLRSIHLLRKHRQLSMGFVIRNCVFALRMCGCFSGRRLHAFFMSVGLLLVLYSPLAYCQQSYYTSDVAGDCDVKHPENAGYLCEADTPSCETAAYFRVPASFHGTLDTLSNSFFNTSSASVASASGLSSPTASLSAGQSLYIPLNCTCHGNYSSRNSTYIIRPGDTFWQLATTTFEGLTTCQALLDGNPTAVPTELQIGQQVNIPFRCACPSAAQKRMAIVSLVTYPVSDGDDVKSVVDMFGVVEQQFLAANSIPNISTPLFAGSTVLVPFLVKPTNPPNITSNSTSPPTAAPVSSSSDGSKTGIYVGVAAAVVALLLAIAFAALFFRRKRRSNKERTDLLPASLPPASAYTTAKMPPDLREGMFEFASSEKLGSFTLDEIRQATQNFSPETHIKGAVYRGVMKGRVVAVKNVTRNVSEELQILKRVHHANLITLIGYCIASPEQSYLVYEYAENGSLNDWLHGRAISRGSGSLAILSWTNRLQVILDVANALEYIHDHTTPSYVHKDIKSSNILLDSKLRGKLANFALAKSNKDTAVTRHIVGTQGYMAPEYRSQGVVSSKMDVFAFGVVLLEILSGKEAVMRDGNGKEQFLYIAVSDIITENSEAKESMKAWMDPSLQNLYPLDCAYSVALLAKSCVRNDPSTRPHMRDVAFTLAKVLDISLEWDPSNVMDCYTSNPVEGR